MATKSGDMRSRFGDSGTLGWLRQEVSRAGQLVEGKQDAVVKPVSWVTGCYLLCGNMVMFGLDCDEGTKTTR